MSSFSDRPAAERLAEYVRVVGGLVAAGADLDRCVENQVRPADAGMRPAVRSAVLAKEEAR